jgi:hypothetical protein
MADRKISDLTALTTPAAGDFLPIVDISEAAAASKNKRITIEELMRGVPDGTAAAPGIAFETDPNTGIYSPGADQLAVATNGTGRLFIDADGNVGVGAPSSITGLELSGNIQIKYAGVNTDPDGSRYLIFNNTDTTLVGDQPFGGISWVNNDASATAGQAAFVKAYAASNTGSAYLTLGTGSQNAATERLRITSAGLVGIGTSSPTNYGAGITSLSVNGSAGSVEDFFFNGTRQGWIGTMGSNQMVIDTAGAAIPLTLKTNNNTALTIDTSQRVGIGTTPTTDILEIYGNLRFAQVSNYLKFANDSITIKRNGANALEFNSYNGFLFNDTLNSTERARLDASGRLLVGTSTTRTFGGTGYIPQFLIEGLGGGASTVGVVRNSANAAGCSISLAKSRGTSAGGVTAVNVNDELALIDFQGADGTGLIPAARIQAFIDGTPGTNDMPGRLVFSTTADGAASPTERMRIDQNGTVDIGGYGNAGLSVTTPVGTPLQLNRTVNDGELVRFKQDGTTEGNITVSGTTVSYNGAHLARWSQLASGAERTEILRGSVLSNLDEMCEWSEEDNEQLNRMKVSDVEGDPNVSGVFQAWDDDDDTYTDDFYCAMTGDFVIRIAEGVTVERGDLLMSAGDGTAKPQDDDIIRSKTIAKVTSTNVSCTYADGSYCVPCVLMAC